VTPIPETTDVIVVGGGTAGAAVAARLVAVGRTVLVLEAGPDPGPLGDPRWPADLLDGARLGTSHDWGFDSGDTYPDQVVRFERSRVIGGCSAHNGAVQTWGHRLDYEGWATIGGPGWDADALTPLFDRASQQLRVRTYATAELTPWQRAWYDAGPEVGLPHPAELVVLCGGTFGSPAVLLRSGIGPAGELRALGIEVVEDRPGVGANLHDQPFVLMSWEGSAQIAHAMDAHAAGGWAPDEQVMAKAATRFDPDGFDLHILPYSPTHLSPTGDRTWHAGAGCLQPRSRGRVWLTSADPQALPRVDHCFYSDPEGHDLAVLTEGVARMRELAAQPALAGLLGRELAPGPAGLTSDADIRAHLLSHVDNYWHPVGTCAMGSACDPAAVVDGRGTVHGVSGCRVADCALMPTVPRATTAMPALVVGERVAAFIAAGT
jgi:choline dehydrogenase-like flavoprotein